ncbi:hypothetical protein JCM10207_006525 [Rhodosporidiobolus poonsookiae]
MPVRPLPLELVALIFQHLEDDLDELGKRENAKQLMLVCKAWQPLAEELAFRKLALKPKGDNGLVDFLSERKELLLHDDISEDVDDLAEAPASIDIALVTQRSAQPFLDLLSGCTRLQHLSLPPAVPPTNLVRPAASSTYAKSLRQLSLCSVCMSTFPIDNLLCDLVSFRGLASLDLTVFDYNTDVYGAPAVTIDTKVPLRKLKFMCFSPADTKLTEHVSRFLVEWIDKDTLRHCHLPSWTGEPTLIEALPSFTSLKSLAIGIPEPQFVQDALPFIFDVVSRLGALEHLVVGVDPLNNLTADDAVPASLDFDDLISALPPTIKLCVVGGVFFDLPPIPLYSPSADDLKEDPPATLGLFVRLPTDDEDDEALEAVDTPRDARIIAPE